MKVVLAVNGTEHRLDVEPRRLLADVLRDDLGLTGTHLGCEQGACGACTVLAASVVEGPHPGGRPLRSCLLFAVQAGGLAITTIEGLDGGGPGRLHPLQSAFSDQHGLQCGFCTPGMILTALALLAVNPDPSEAAVREGIAGNICRCTGYQKIVAAVLDGAARLREGGAPAPVVDIARF